MNLSSKVYIAGHRGLVGSALVRRLQAKGYHNLVLRTHAELELRDQAAVQAFFAQEKPDYVILAAAKVGGIHANNTYPKGELQRKRNNQITRGLSPHLKHSTAVFRMICWRRSEQP